MQQKGNLVVRAETLMTHFVIKHNVEFSAADHLTHLVKVMFLGSSIASKFASRRTKIAAIAKTQDQETEGGILEKIRKIPFSILSDGSFDHGVEEQLDPIVRFFDTDVDRVISELLEIATTKERSSGKIFWTMFLRKTTFLGET
ncbi:hypothetical protein scyTo_0022323 [Scyliorhinus torazame]|uniref:Uncharacterized protein n=1 Tax=Scyliorhinus torazame TaxID=75743 RepID=A0A401QAK6_SCYTO|nr:hypothetical protein [Scyliorhinus torazame]